METARFQLSANDIAEVQQAVFGKSLQGWKAMLGLAALVGVDAAIVMFVSRSHAGRPMTIIGAALVLPMLAGLYLLINYHIVLPVRARWQFRKAGAARETVEIHWNPENLRVTTDSGNAICPWEDFSRHIETPRFLLLLTPHDDVTILPKAAIGDMGLEAIRDYLVVHAVKPAGFIKA